MCTRRRQDNDLIRPRSRVIMGFKGDTSTSTEDPPESIELAAGCSSALHVNLWTQTHRHSRNDGWLSSLAAKEKSTLQDVSFPLLDVRRRSPGCAWPLESLCCNGWCLLHFLLKTFAVCSKLFESIGPAYSIGPLDGLEVWGPTYIPIVFSRFGFGSWKPPLTEPVRPRSPRMPSFFLVLSLSPMATDDPGPWLLRIFDLPVSHSRPVSDLWRDLFCLWGSWALTSSIGRRP